MRKLTPYTIYFNVENPQEKQLLDRIEEARQLKGMSKKGFFLYGIANLVPPLAQEIVSYLTAKPYSADRKVVTEDIKDATATND